MNSAVSPVTRTISALRVTRCAASISWKSQTPREVLSFWFGPGNYWDAAKMSSPGTALATQNPLWWGMRADFSGKLSQDEKAAVDESCRAYAEVIRACGRGELVGPMWESPDGIYAQMLLCDQLSRNSFRGTAEAFAYDAQGAKLARKIFDNRLYEDFEIGHFTFLLTPGQHSESPDDHEIMVQLIAFMKDKFGVDNPVTKGLESHVNDHKVVIDLFGRYPHRNEALGRENTPEEAAWLGDYDNLPGWARSQMGPKK